MDESSKVTVGYSLLVWAALTALMAVILQTFSAPAWGWGAGVLWVALALTAALAQSDPTRRAYLTATLKHSRYTQLYLSIARPVNDWLWTRLARMDTGADGKLRPPSDRTPLLALLRAALTWRVLNLALLLAVAYPVLALLRPWIMGGDAVLGAGVVVFPATGFWPDRAVVLGQFVALTAGLIGRKLASASPRRFWRSAADWLPVIAVAVAFAFAFAGAFAFAVAGAYAFAVAVAALWDRGRPGLALTVLTLGWIGGLVAVTLFTDLRGLPADRKALIVFLVVLPLINGLFDTLSYSATLATMRKGLATPWAWALGVLDLLIGGLLFLALGATMVAVIAALNAVGNAPLFDLTALFAGLRSDPGDYWWLYLILFFTLLPTALHLGIAALALQGVIPRATRRRVAQWIEASPTSALDAVRGCLAQSLIWWLPLMALAGLGYALWLWLGHAAGMAGLFYLDALETLALWIGAL